MTGYDLRRLEIEQELDAHYDVFHLEGRQELLKEFRERART